MRNLTLLSSIFAVVLLAGAAYADSITGTVTNATTSKPAAGANVTLVDPTSGMAELGSAKTDGQGKFKIEAPPAQGPRLVRAERGGVNYFKMLPPGLTNVDVSVYDAAPSLEGITGSADVVRLQSDGSSLQGIELFAIRNASNPAKTLAGSATFEFVLPDGAQVDGADAQGPNGQPITTTTSPGKQKNHYTFSYPLKPGETRFQVQFHMPYSGKLSFSPNLTRDFDHYVLVLPTTMTFAPKDAKLFQAMTNQPGSNVQVSLKAKAGQDLSYSVSGTGTIQDEQADASSNDGGGGMGGASNDNRPGGGLGRPIDAPDGLAKYRWYILGLLLTVLIGGGIWTHERTKQAEAEEVVAANPIAASAQGSSRTTVAAQPAPAAPQNLLLAALKEELFELEVERQQGKLSQEEYDKARSALEQTLQRALSRTRNT